MTATSMDSSLRRVALVTGAGQGIGAGIALQLARNGMDIVIGDVQAESDASKTVSAVRDTGADVLYVRADVADPNDRALLLNAIRERFGRLHVLVNNAGVAPRVRADITEMTEESYERVMNINLKGPFFLTQSAACWMIEQKQSNTAWTGCIVNISSISATVASPNRAEYCLSKAGVSMATRLWAARLGEADIPVYEIQPGIIATDMTAGVKEKYDRLIADGLCIQKRWGTPEDIGQAVTALAAGCFPYSTGQVIRVDGGLSIPRL